MEKVNRKQISKILLICILVCALSITTFAEYREEYDGKNISEFRLYGQSTSEGNSSWRVINLTENDGVYTTPYQTYVQTRQRLQFSFTEQKLISNIYLSFTFVLNEDVYGNGNIQFSDNAEQIAYVVQSTQGGASTAWFNESDVTEQKSVKNNEIKYVFTYNGDVKTIRSIRAFTSITTVSTAYSIKDISLVINDEEYKVVAYWDNTVEDAQSMIDQMTMDMPDQEDYVSDIKSNIRPYDESVLRVWGYMGDSHFLTTIVLMTIAFATISFILYGKKEAK